MNPSRADVQFSRCGPPRKTLLRMLVVGLVCLAPAPRARAMIEKLYGVREVMDASQVIVLGQIEDVDAERRTAVMRVTKTIKGNCAFERIKMNLGVGQSWHPDALLEHLNVGAPVLFFYDIQGKRLAALSYTDGIWSQFFGELQGDPAKTWWLFTHIELRMNRTFRGAASDLVRIVTDAQAGKRAAPFPNRSLPPLRRETLMRKRPVVSTPGAKKAPRSVKEQRASGNQNQKKEKEEKEKELKNARPKQAPAKPRRPVGPRPVTPPAPPEQADGYEAHPEWKVESWGNPVKVAVIDGTGGRGKVLQIRYAGGKHNKIAVTRTLQKDLSQAKRLLFEAVNRTETPVRVAWAVWTSAEKEYFESPPVELPAGRWRYDLAVDFTARNFKCAATDWEYRSPLRNRHHVISLTLLVYGAPEQGTLLIDRLRPEGGYYFVRSLPLPHGGGESWGVAWADYDGDGDLDALVCSTTRNLLYQNQGGEFVDRTAAARLRGGSRCASWADYDGDGDLDLLFSTPALWTNYGGTFRDDSWLLPPLPDRETEGAGWIDADGDGRPDIMLTNGEHGISLWRNPGNELAPLEFLEFKDVSDAWGLGPRGLGAGNGDFLAITDYDADGFPDFLYNLGHGLLAHNEDGKRFRPALEAQIRYKTDGVHKLGVAFGDFDNDGDLDLFVPQRGKSLLFRNNNDFTFTAVTDQAGDLAKLTGHARTAAWGDVNSDGHLDLVIGFADAPLRLLLNDGTGKFTDRTAMAGLARFPCAYAVTGLAFADWDRDGDIDLLLSGEKTAGVLINAFPRAAAARLPLRVSLASGECPGAIVHVKDEQDQPLGVRQLGLVQNFSSQGPPEALYYVKPGKYKVSILRTNGTVKQNTVHVGRTEDRGPAGTATE